MCDSIPTITQESGVPSEAIPARTSGVLWMGSSVLLIQEYETAVANGYNVQHGKQGFVGVRDRLDTAGCIQQ